MKKILGFILFFISFNLYAACTTTISVGANVATAIASQAAGTTLCLNAGNYGTVTVQDVNKASMTTIEPAVAGSATIIGFLLYDNNSNLKINGFKILNTQLQNCNHDIQITNNVWQAGEDGLSVLAFSTAQCGASDKNILIEGNTLIDTGRAWSEGKIGIVYYNGVTIRNNLIQGNGGPGPGDGIQTGGTTDNLLIEGNTFKDILQAPCDASGAHCDSIQIVANSNLVTIKNNFFINDDVGLQHHDNTAPVLFTGNVLKDVVVSIVNDSPDVDNSTFSHNVFYNAGDQYLCAYPGFPSATGCTVRDNIFYTTNLITCTTGCTTSFNLFNSVSQGTNAVTGTPTFAGGAPAGITSYAGFALATGSVGKGTASDGLDRGINISGADTTPPTVSSTTPVNAATGVSTGFSPTVTFSEPMAPATITATTLSIKRTSDNAAVTSVVTYAGNTATLNPNASLAASTQYTGTVTTGVTDAAGNALATTFTFTFTTSAGDTTPPTVSVKNPVPGEISVPTNFAPQFIMSEPMTDATVTGTNVELRNTGTNALITTTVNYLSGNYKYVTITPTALLAANTTYTVIAKAALADAAGNPMGADNSWTFTTGAAFVENQLIINNETNTANNPHIISGQTFSSSRGNCLQIDNSSFIQIKGNRFIDCWINGVSMGTGSHDITILGNYFERTGGMTYATTTTGNIKIIANKSKDTYKRPGNARGQSITQFNISSGSGNLIAGNYSTNDNTKSSMEDGINIHQHNSSAGNELIVENNILVGSSRSTSSAGINLGDGGGSYEIARNNICYNCGQSGINVVGGSNLTLANNIIYGAQLPWGNVGTALWNPTLANGTCSNITYTGNTTKWANAAGSSNTSFISGPPNDCTSITNSGNVTNVDTSLTVLPAFGEFIPPSGLTNRFDFELDCLTCDFFGNSDRETNLSYMPTFDANGKAGGSAYFDSTKVITGTLKPADFTGAYSFSFLYKPDSEALTSTKLFVTETLDGLGVKLYDRWLFYANQQRNISKNYSFSMVYNNATGRNAGLITLGSWNHIAVTYGSGIQKLYVNGTLVSSTRRTKQMTSQFNQLKIGHSSMAGKKAKGRIDSFMIGNVAWTQSDITNLNNQTFR